MTSPLSPETRALLRQHGRKPGEARFNLSTWAEWETKWTRGRFRVLPRTDGKLVLFERDRPNGTPDLGVYGDARAAMGHLEALAAGEERKEAAE